MYHSRSADAPPGLGASETWSTNATAGVDREFLQATSHWRRMLSNFADTPFLLDDLRWRSVEHYFQAHKFLAIDPAYFHSFTLDSGSQLGQALGAPVKRAGGKRVHPLDGPARAAWEATKYAVQERALRAKFQQHETHRAVLLATGWAKLTHRPARARHVVVELGLMRVRQRLRG